MEKDQTGSLGRRFGIMLFRLDGHSFFLVVQLFFKKTTVLFSYFFPAELFFTAVLVL